MEISGKIKVITPGQQVSASFKKRELVVTTEEQYPQHILIEFTQDKCDLLNSYRAGQDVKVSINIAGREWVNPQGETKYFNSIKGWRIVAVGQSPAQRTAQTQTNPQQTQEAVTFTEEEYDDRPF